MCPPCPAVPRLCAIQVWRYSLEDSGQARDGHLTEEDRESLNAAKQVLEVDLVQLEAGEAAFIAAVARGEVDPAEIGVQPDIASLIELPPANKNMPCDGSACCCQR